MVVNFGAVRLVAGVAGEASGVIRGGDLGEGLGLGAVGFVATGADDGGVELRRFHGGWVVGMFGLGAVAGFAGDNDVPTLFFLIDYVGVTGLTGVMAGEATGRAAASAMAAPR